MKIFIIFAFLAAVFRFWQIGSQPSGLYWDELDTGYQSYSLLHTGRDYFGDPFPAHLHSFADYRSGLYMYLTVPWISLLGMTVMSVRITAAVFSVISLFFFFYLAYHWLHLGKYSWVSVMVAAFAPWLLIQGRIAAESTLVVPFLLLGLIGFLEFIKNGRYLWLASLGFGLTLWSYGTAKVFLPIFILVLILIHWHRFRNLKLEVRNFILPVILFILICLPVVYETVFGHIGLRVGELSVFTDPTTQSEVNYQRLEAALGSGKTRQVGMQPTLIEKIVFNKISSWGTVLIGNYSRALSTTFLFLKGDPELRHNLNEPNTGQFYLVELLPFILGLFYVFRSYFMNHKSRLLLFWLLVSPLPSVFTRDGGTHGPRLLFMFPVLVFIISLGIAFLLRKKSVRLIYFTIYMLSVCLTGYYFFTIYRVNSSSHFNTGFIPAVRLALKQSVNYDRVILDAHNENALMAYLFVSRFPPAVFQKSFPLPSEDLSPGISGYRFGNIDILYPGTRDWSRISLKGHNLVISSADQPDIGSVSPLFTIKNPDDTNSFVAFKSLSKTP